MLPESAYLQFTPDMRTCRLLNGMWQVSGAHGSIDPIRALPNMEDYQQDGFTTWDLADHYGPAEDFIGIFRRSLSAQGLTAPRDFQAFTKWVPRPMPMTRRVVEQAVDVSLRRMAADTLDVLQFHWWDYENAAYLEALGHLSTLRDAGKIRHLALTNFDTQRLHVITEHGYRIVSNQVQFSILDQRPLARMVDFCKAHNIWLLAYGSYCGGLLSETYLNKPEPGPAALQTASLRKYKNMIDLWGGWSLFQELLHLLNQIAQKHNVSLANVGVRYILDQPQVAGVIAGVRLGISDHRSDNARVFSFTLDEQDRHEIQSVTRKSRNLYQIIGDCGDEYRR